jgi:ESCRT-I complex subunit TSG101
MEISRLLHSVPGVYVDPNRVSNDSTRLLSNTIGRNLQPIITSYTANDGSVSYPRILAFTGTVVMTFRGVQYYIPVEIIVPGHYPKIPPVVFVRPTDTMMITPNHKHVANDGRLYMPYLHSWYYQSSNLVDLCQKMSSLFSESPPCQQKPTSFHTHNNNNNTNTHTNTNLHANVHATINNNDMETKRQLISHTQKFLLHTYHPQSKQLITEYTKDQLLLQKKTPTTNHDSDLNNLLQKQSEFSTFEKTLQNNITTLESYLEEIKKQQSQTNDTKEQQETPSLPPIDELVIPNDIHSAQLLSLVGEIHAWTDMLLALEQALKEGTMDLNMYLKLTREVADRQFKAKVHLARIKEYKNASETQYSMRLLNIDNS